MLVRALSVPKMRARLLRREHHSRERRPGNEDPEGAEPSSDAKDHSATPASVADRSTALCLRRREDAGVRQHPDSTGKYETAKVIVTERGRGADGLPTHIEYTVVLKITKKLLITDADFRPIPPKTADEERMNRVSIKLNLTFNFVNLDFCILNFLVVFLGRLER